MNRLKPVVATTVFFLLGAIAWVDEPLPTVTLSVGEIARQVQLSNLEIFKAARNVERAREDLVGEPELMDSSLSVGGGYGSVGSGDSGLYGQSSLTLRLLPQLSAGASVEVEEPGVFGESVSLTVKPLEPSRRTYPEEKVLATAVVRQRYLKGRIYLDSEQAALNLLISDMERELARATEDLQQKKYELDQRQQEIGEASFQDVQDQLVNLIEAREELFSKESGYLADWRTLQLLFAPGQQRISVAPLAMTELMEMVGTRRTQVKSFEQARPVTEELENLRLELAALEAQLEATPVWSPELSLSAAVDFPYTAAGSHRMSVGLSFSPNQLKRDERENLREDIEIKRMEIAAETSAADLQKSLDLQNIALVEQALASARIQEQRDRVSLQEAELLFQQGRRTSLELEQLRLNLRRTQILTFRSAAEVYKALGVYQLLFPGE